MAGASCPRSPPAWSSAARSGNLLDRISAAARRPASAAHVVDFIDVQWWPIFNVADIGICVGAGLLAILSFRNP